MAGDRLKERHEGQVGHDDPVFGMIDDPGDLLRKQAGIDRVIDRADARYAVPGLEVPIAVPRQRRHAIAELDSVMFEPLGDLQRPFSDLRVIRAVHRAFDRP